MIAKCLAFSAPICAMAAEGEKTQNSETEGGNNKLLMGVCLAAAAGIAYKVIGQKKEEINLTISDLIDAEPVKKAKIVRPAAKV